MRYEVLYICVVSYLSVLCFIFLREQLGTVEKSRQKYKAAPLTVEFVPFFYRKCFILLLSHTLSFFLYWKHSTGGLVWGLLSISLFLSLPLLSSSFLSGSS